MDQRDIIRRLSLGEGFGGAPGHRPERIDTHISVIFLVGDDVFKLKRAITTSYLDYGTLEARHRLCRAEVEINRRTAPRIYLDVVPVRLSADGGLVVGEGPGEPVEWLVHMRRFDQATLFDNLAKSGGLTATLLTELADEIAAFHRSAAVVEATDAADRIRFVIDENARELEEKAGGIIDRSHIRQFDRSCRSAFEQARDTISRRGAQGFVRHCHGDLHLRNICLVDEKPTLFDAIEFSEPISHIDVLFDFAFLAMDLEHRGLRDAANLVFNRYLYRTGDTADLSVFPLYLALRAGIRAHVSAMAAAGQEDPAERAALEQDARSYLRLGLAQFTAASPRLIAIGGVSGSGKSTIARGLAPRLGRAPGALVLSSDLVRKRLRGVDPLTRLTDAAYDAETDRAVYDGLETDATRALASGYAVVLDATYMDPARRQGLESVARQAGVELNGFWLEASAASLRDRLQRRVGDPSDATISVLERQLEKDMGDIGWQRIDAARPREAVIADIAHALGAGEEQTASFAIDLN